MHFAEHLLVSVPSPEQRHRAKRVQAGDSAPRISFSYLVKFLPFLALSVFGRFSIFLFRDLPAVDRVRSYKCSIFDVKDNNPPLLQTPISQDDHCAAAFPSTIQCSTGPLNPANQSGKTSIILDFATFWNTYAQREGQHPTYGVSQSMAI